jgi:O6-methylguanine-DNA--protein-cysteine methyltransferase
VNYLDEKKLEVMKMVVDREKSISWAAAKLKRSEKTIRRYRKELLENPNADLVHKNRGREPANKTDHELIWDLCGKVATYSQIAALVGNCNLRRYVRNALHKNPSNAFTPYHPVVNAKVF